jgi:hypothetical protein
LNWFSFWSTDFGKPSAEKGKKGSLMSHVKQTQREIKQKEKRKIRAAWTRQNNLTALPPDSPPLVFSFGEKKKRNTCPSI